MFAIASNVLRDRYRLSEQTASVSLEAIGDAPDPAGADHAWGAGVWEATTCALLLLPAEQREVLLLRMFGDLPFRVVASRLGIPESTARTRAFHGLRRLRAAVAAHLRQEGWLVECEDVRARLVRVGFGLAPDRAEEIKRHLATCPDCRQEVDLVSGMVEAVALEAGRSMMVAAWAMHDSDGSATSYWLNQATNRSDHP